MPFDIHAYAEFGRRSVPNEPVRAPQNQPVKPAEQTAAAQTSKAVSSTNFDTIEIRNCRKEDTNLSAIFKQVRKNVVQDLNEPSLTPELESLRDEIRSGHYEVDPAAIAHKMLKNSD